MVWQFWKRNKDSTKVKSESIEWPDDAYDTLRLLLGMFIKNTSPFSKSDSIEFALSMDATPAADFAIKGYQLWLWFALFEHKFGKVAAQMARDSFSLLMDELTETPQLAGMTEWIFKIQEDAAVAADNISEDKKKLSVVGSEEILLPREYFLATYFLMALDNSPYYQKEALSFNDDDWALCGRLIESRTIALEIFVPMLEAIPEFDARSFPDWKWSARLGAHERHLQRRYKNPLFAKNRQKVTYIAIFEARELDSAALKKCANAVSEVEARIFGDDVPEEWSDFLNQLRDELDEIGAVTRVIGENAVFLTEHIAELRKTVIDIWKETAKNHPQILAALDKAEKAHMESLEFRSTDWLRQVMHPTGIIPADEIVASLLSENLESFRANIEVLAGVQDINMDEIRSSATNLVATSFEPNSIPEDIAEKLDLLHG